MAAVRHSTRTAAATRDEPTRDLTPHIYRSRYAVDTIAGDPNIYKSRVTVVLASAAASAPPKLDSSVLQALEQELAKRMSAERRKADSNDRMFARTMKQLRQTSGISTQDDEEDEEDEECGPVTGPVTQPIVESTLSSILRPYLLSEYREHDFMATLKKMIPQPKLDAMYTELYSNSTTTSTSTPPPSTSAFTSISSTSNSAGISS